MRCCGVFCVNLCLQTWTALCSWFYYLPYDYRFLFSWYLLHYFTRKLKSLPRDIHFQFSVSFSFFKTVTVSARSHPMLSSLSYLHPPWLQGSVSYNETAHNPEATPYRRGENSEDSVWPFSALSSWFIVFGLILGEGAFNKLLKLCFFIFLHIWKNRMKLNGRTS